MMMRENQMMRGDKERDKMCANPLKEKEIEELDAAAGGVVLFALVFSNTFSAW